MNQQHQNYINGTKNDINQAITAIHRLKSRQLQWNALDYENTLITDDPNLTVANVGAAIFAGGDALMAVLEGGNGGNLFKLTP